MIRQWNRYNCRVSSHANIWCSSSKHHAGIIICPEKTKYFHLSSGKQYIVICSDSNNNAYFCFQVKTNIFGVLFLKSLSCKNVRFIYSRKSIYWRFFLRMTIFQIWIKVFFWFCGPLLFLNLHRSSVFQLILFFLQNLDDGRVTLEIFRVMEWTATWRL